MSKTEHSERRITDVLARLLSSSPLKKRETPFDKLRVSGKDPLKSGRGSAHAEPVEARGRVLQRAASLVDAALWTYRAAISPFVGPCCRFAPSCSVYASQAVRRHGIVRGSWMALRRVLRCHPFHRGGWDPVV